MRCHLILCCLCISQLLYGQLTFPEFGYNTGEEINLKECPFEKSAGAVVLYDGAIADHDEEYHLITHRRIKIKILNQREADQGNIRIRFYSKDKFEYIENIRGITTNYENGEFRTTLLDKRSIFTEQEDNLFSSMKFAMPNVKAGSIIEYEFDSYMKHYGGLSAWWFQNEIPTIKSCYLLTLLPGTEFQYSVQKKLSYPITIKPVPEEGRVYFEMVNIP